MGDKVDAAEYPCASRYLKISICVGLILFFAPIAGISLAHAAAPITPSGLNTQVSGAIITGSGPTQTTQYNITGGTRPGGAAGTNLFHSFGDFNVPTNNIANFLNSGSADSAGNLLPAGLATTNILGRVTGGNPSVIFGLIQTNGPNGFGNANLFLMNPYGFLFGPNATVNVGGMVAFTTADYLRFQGTQTLYNNASTPESLSPLSIAPVAAFGFLGNNPAAIAIQGSTLQVAQGQSISLVGGNQGFIATDPDTGNPIPVPGGTTMTGGRLSAPGGQINLASVAGPGEVSAVDFMPTTGMAMGNISLSQGALLDVSADAAGTVRIRGGQLVINDATISADTGNTSGASSAIDINVTGDVAISDTRGVPAITARTTGDGNAGAIQINAANLTATSTFLDPNTQNATPFALIDTHTSGSGKGGDVNITATGNLTATGSPGLMFLIDSGTLGLAGGTGGDVTIKAQNIQLTRASINTGDLVARSLLQDAVGSGGNLSITADTFQLDGSGLATSSFGARAGDFSLTARDIQINNNSLIEVISLEGGSTLTIKASKLVTDSLQIQNETAFAPGGDTTITADVVELKNGSSVLSSTFGDGAAGDIRITATDHLTLSDDPTSQGSVIRPSGLFSNSFGDLGSFGNAGSIVVTSPRVEITGGARIDTTTQTSGHGGDVTITATNMVSISGSRLNDIPEDLFNLGGVHPSGIFTRTIGSDSCSGPCGNAGNISITTGSLSLGGGAQINSGTSSTGRGGDITIHASDMISLAGTLTDATPGGIFSRTTGTTPDAGAGGNISLTAGQSVTISDGAAISASSTGPGNTGNIQINAGNQFTMTNSTVTTEANQASGGTIKITTSPSGTVQLTNSTISASVLDGTGGGGSVNIDPQYVIMLNSQILANAVQGPGGNITIAITNGGLFLPDANSTVSASSQFGVDGTVTIQSPNAPASGKIIPLSQKPLLATSLLNQRCASLAGGEFSSFTVAGRDSLPTEPGAWLASPLALSLAGTGGGPLADKGERAGIDDDPARETTILSLRQIAPAGFLTQAFAIEGSAGCQS